MSGGKQPCHSDAPALVMSWPRHSRQPPAPSTTLVVQQPCHGRQNIGGGHVTGRLVTQPAPVGIKRAVPAQAGGQAGSLARWGRAGRRGQGRAEQGGCSTVVVSPVRYSWTYRQGCNQTTAWSCPLPLESCQSPTGQVSTPSRSCRELEALRSHGQRELATLLPWVAKGWLGPMRSPGTIPGDEMALSQRAGHWWVARVAWERCLLAVRETWDGQPWQEAGTTPGKEARALHGDEGWLPRLLILLSFDSHSSGYGTETTASATQPTSVATF